MTKSELFKRAHKMARNTVAIVGNYSIAFKLALIHIYKEVANNAYISAVSASSAVIECVYNIDGSISVVNVRTAIAAKPSLFDSAVNLVKNNVKKVSNFFKKLLTI